MALAVDATLTPWCRRPLEYEDRAAELQLDFRRERSALESAANRQKQTQQGVAAACDHRHFSCLMKFELARDLRKQSQIASLEAARLNQQLQLLQKDVQGKVQIQKQSRDTYAAHLKEQKSVLEEYTAYCFVEMVRDILLGGGGSGNETDGGGGEPPAAARVVKLSATAMSRGSYVAVLLEERSAGLAWLGTLLRELIAVGCHKDPPEDKGHLQHEGHQWEQQQGRHVRNGLGGNLHDGYEAEVGHPDGHPDHDSTEQPQHQHPDERQHQTAAKTWAAACRQEVAAAGTEMQLGGI
ncbi:MAG: hypothetical protein FRX49_05384 [Trebouxia sp. A1-2]|nr:MAG: hypothetical protein FRX49_05384 [Trebouxia sp. A1-2]